ncbi:MAG: hypothetical protein AAF805_08380 [Planctomycetota bacterium]
MRGSLLVIATIALTITCWGLYGPTLHNGQQGMSLVEGDYARLRPFVCVGLAYFAIGVVVPTVLLRTRGESGAWTRRGVTMSLLAGAFGAIGALGIIMAFRFGGKPSVVMPLVFGGAPVVNALLTMYWSRRVKDAGPVFLAGLLMVLMGSMTVLISKPSGKPHSPPAASVAEAPVDESSEEAKPDESTVAEVEREVAQAGWSLGRLIARLASIATVIACWGAYGPVLHIGQSAMQQSRLRPLLCVGLAYFAIAVVVPTLLLSGPVEEASAYLHRGGVGSLWSLAAGAAGAVGALGIIMAFNFGGRPIYVMPLVFGGAPVVNTLATVVARGGLAESEPLRLAAFLAGLLLVIAGAALVLVFAPKGPPPKKATGAPTTDAAQAEPSGAGPDPESPQPESPSPDAG